MTLPELLANTPHPDPQISGDWLVKIVGAIAAGAALILGKIWGRKEAQGVKLNEPVPNIPTVKINTPPTWSDHKALADRVMRTEADILRIEGELKEIRTTQTEQFQKLMAAGADREQRIGDKIEGFARAVHARVDEVIRTCQACQPPANKRPR